MTVYVLHFDPPYRHARHYIGWTDKPVEERLKEHVSGSYNGSPLVRAAVAAGCKVIVAMVFEGKCRAFERMVKDRHDVRSWCPLCDSPVRRKPPEGISDQFRRKPRRVRVCD